jgi:DNA polymerase-3 subunit epsilon
LHGALLDAELLAEVYLAMTRGQNSFSIDLAVETETTTSEASIATMEVASIIVLPATEEELAEHEATLAKLDKEVKGTCVWRAATGTAD